MAFYVGWQINRVYDKFINVRYPSEFQRSQRSILNFKVFKANEFRNFLIYSAIYIFKDILPVAYYEHLIIYVVFMRILTQDKITNEDIADSRPLINRFVNDYERLYGSVNVSFNVKRNSIYYL